MATERSGSFLRFWPIAVLLVIAGTVYASGLHRQISIAWLVQQQTVLLQTVAERPVLAPLAYILLYTVSIACAVPGGLVFSTAAGLLFGTARGGAYAVIAITLGSTILFMAARSALRPLAERLASRMLGRALPALEGDGFLYMLAVRLVPFTPFWVVNLAAAMTRMKLSAYVAATLIGIAPITYILAAAGSGIGDTLAAGAQPRLGTILRPEIVAPLLLLALLSLAPIGFKRWQHRRSRVAAATRPRAT